MSRDRNYLDAKRRKVLEKVADAILHDKSSHRKLEQILDTTLQFQRLRAQGLDVKVCDGGLILIPGRAEGKSEGMVQSARSKGAVQLAMKTYVKCVGILVAGLASCFLLADYSDLLEAELSAAQLPPTYVEEIYCRATQGCED
jgi:hypothetical protein